ncbi:MFS transporter [Spirillospora sp. CA-253888]
MRTSLAGRGVLALACAAQFMVVLDVSVVNVALPAIRDELEVGAVGLSWVAGAYALVFGGFLLLGGRLADLYGRRRVFAAGLAVFAGASLAGGLAGGAGTLIAARAVQGLGAAVLAPATLTVLTTTFPEGPERTRALAVWTAVGLTGGAAGNLLGGLLTEAASWRWILLINVPIGAVALAAAVRVLPGDVRGRDGRRDGRRGRRLDVPGAVLVTAGLCGLTYGLSAAGPGRGAALAAAVAALAAFVAVETRHAPHPLVPPPLLRARPLALGNTIMLLAGACFQIPMWYFLTLHMQNDLHYSALRTGLAFLPHTLLMLLVGLHVTPRLMRRLDHRALIAAGALAAAAGFAWQSGTTPGDGYVAGILGPAVLMAVGGGLFTTPLTTVVTGGVPREDAGAASGLMNTAKQAGGVLGLAALAGAPDRAFAACAGMLVVIAALAPALPAARAPARAGGASPDR